MELRDRAQAGAAEQQARVGACHAYHPYFVPTMPCRRGRRPGRCVRLGSYITPAILPDRQTDPAISFSREEVGMQPPNWESGAARPSCAPAVTVAVGVPVELGAGTVVCYGGCGWGMAVISRDADDTRC